MSEKQLLEGWWKRWKEPTVGSGIRGRTPAGSLEERGSHLATTADPPAGECCQCKTTKLTREPLKPLKIFFMLRYYLVRIR